MSGDPFIYSGPQIISDEQLVTLIQLESLIGEIRRARIVIARCPHCYTALNYFDGGSEISWYIQTMKHNKESHYEKCEAYKRHGGVIPWNS